MAIECTLEVDKETAGPGDVVHYRLTVTGEPMPQCDLAEHSRTPCVFDTDDCHGWKRPLYCIELLYRFYGETGADSHNFYSPGTPMQFTGLHLNDPGCPDYRDQLHNPCMDVLTSGIIRTVTPGGVEPFCEHITVEVAGGGETWCSVEGGFCYTGDAPPPPQFPPTWPAPFVCPTNPELAPDDPDCPEGPRCPSNPDLPLHDPDCEEAPRCPSDPDLILMDPDCPDWPRCPRDPHLAITDPDCPPPPPEPCWLPMMAGMSWRTNVDARLRNCNTGAGARIWISRVG